MVEIVWTEPALSDLDAIADYISLENPPAAGRFVKEVIKVVKMLADHPEIGPIVPELPTLDYRQLVKHPCRIFYRVKDNRVLIVHIMRSERNIRLGNLK